LAQDSISGHWLAWNKRSKQLIKIVVDTIYQAVLELADKLWCKRLEPGYTVPVDLGLVPSDELGCNWTFRKTVPVDFSLIF
jgi:hypothetical protein